MTIAPCLPFRAYKFSLSIVFTSLVTSKSKSLFLISSSTVICSDKPKQDRWFHLCVFFEVSFRKFHNINEKKTNFSYLLQFQNSTCKSIHMLWQQTLYILKINKVEIILILYDKMPLLTIRYSEHRERNCKQKMF